MMRSNAKVVTIIVCLNLAVFAIWLWGLFEYADREFLQTHFLVSWTAVSEGRWWTLLTSVFSHMLVFHIFLNMYALMGFGPIIEATIGSMRFLRFYLTAGFISSVAHIAVSAKLLGNPDLQALGASGAVSGVIMLFSLLFPSQKILIMGLIPVPAFVGSILIIGLDVWGLWAQAEGGGLPIGHGAHLGGALTGAVYYFAIIRPRFARFRRASGYSSLEAAEFSQATPEDADSSRVPVAFTNQEPNGEQGGKQHDPDRNK